MAAEGGGRSGQGPAVDSAFQAPEFKSSAGHPLLGGPGLKLWLRMRWAPNLVQLALRL